MNMNTHHTDASQLLIAFANSFCSFLFFVVVAAVIPPICKFAYQYLFEKPNDNACVIKFLE